MSVSEAYLAATVNAVAVAKHHGMKAFINMSQMTLSQMSITETTVSPAAQASLVQCILENGYALAMIAGWHPNV